MFKIHFLGVRGSTPCSNQNVVKYGGHTSCIYFEFNQQIFIIDAGSGIIGANPKIDLPLQQETHLFLSHVHLDHVMGLPFYLPFWNANHKISIYSGTTKPYNGIQNTLENLFSPPIFPIPMKAFPSQKKYVDFDANDSFKFGNLSVKTHKLNHPNGAIGYRFELDNQSFCYISDHEHDESYNTNGLIQFIQGTNLLIYDATYDDINLHKYKGWGHSTWQEAVRLGEKAKVKHIGIFHHDPSSTDSQLEQLQHNVLKEHSNVTFLQQDTFFNLMNEKFEYIQ